MTHASVARMNPEFHRLRDVCPSLSFRKVMLHLRKSRACHTPASEPDQSYPMRYLIVVYTGEMKKCEVSTLQCNFTGAASWEVLGTFVYSSLSHDKNTQIKNLYRPLLPAATETLGFVGLRLKRDPISSLSPEHDIKLYPNSVRI